MEKQARREAERIERERKEQVENPAEGGERGESE